MKKVLIPLILILAMMLSACGGLQSSDAIKANALFSGKTLELPIKNKSAAGDFYADGAFRFTSGSLTPAKLEKAVQERADVEMTLLGDSVSDGVLFHVDNGDTTADDYFLTGATYLFDDGIKYDDGYVFSGMAARIGDADAADDADKAILIPQHLFADEALRTSVAPRIEYDALYETNAGVDEFSAFYAASGWYSFDTYGPKIILRGYAKEPVDDAENMDFDLPFVPPYVVTIAFTETDEGQFVSYQRYLTLEECLAFSDLELAEKLSAVQLTEENGAYYTDPADYADWQPAPEDADSRRANVFLDHACIYAPYDEGSEERIEEIALFMLKRSIHFNMNAQINADSTFLITAYKDLSVTVYAEDELPDGYVVERDYTIQSDDPPMTFWYVAPAGSYKFIGELEGVGSSDDFGAEEWVTDFGKEDEIFLSIMLFQNRYSMSTHTFEAASENGA